MVFETKYLGLVIYDWFMNPDSDEWITKVLPLLQEKQVQERAKIIESHQPPPDSDKTMTIELPNLEAEQELVKKMN